jgi:hypothetical protein
MRTVADRLRTRRRPGHGRSSLSLENPHHRDAEFEQKMAEVLCVYREVQVLKKAAAKPNKPVAIVSYDEKPGIQAIATTAPDLPPVPGVHATFARDHDAAYPASTAIKLILDNHSIAPRLVARSESYNAIDRVAPMRRAYEEVNSASSGVIM